MFVSISRLYSLFLLNHRGWTGVTGGKKQRKQLKDTISWQENGSRRMGRRKFESVFLLYRNVLFRLAVILAVLYSCHPIKITYIAGEMCDRDFSPETLATTSTLLLEVTKVVKPIFLDVLAKRDEKIMVLEKRLQDIYNLVHVQRPDTLPPFLHDKILQLSKPDWLDLPFQEVPEELCPIMQAHLLREADVERFLKDPSKHPLYYY